MESAFADTASAGYADSYVSHLVSRFDVIESSLRRTSTSLVVLMLAFVFLANADTAEIALGPFKTTSVTGVLIVVPAIVALLYAELVALVLARNVYREALSETMRVAHPELWESGLHRLMGPPSVQLWGSPAWQELTSGRSSRWARPARTFAFLTLAAAVVLGAMVFLGYAYWTLLDRPGADHRLVIVSAIFAGINMVRAFADTELSD